ncbi:MAG: polyphosphate kinase 1, partial [Spirochaetales bacterium]
PEDEGPFPSTGNLRIHAAFQLKPDDGSGPDRLAIVQVPPNLGRFVRLPPGDDGVYRVALLDDLVLGFGDRMFPGYTVRERTLFKVTRDADIGVDEDRDDDFVAAMEEVLANRQNSWPVRMTISADSEILEGLLSKALGLGQDDIYIIAGPIDLKSFMELATQKGFDELRFAAHDAVEVLQLSEDTTIWDEIRRRDIILHAPYESFKPVLDFVDAASRDPSVLAIKATLYRTSGDSPVVKALTRAAHNGKQVVVVVELKARFDEERNIAWASRLEQAGAIVVYGAARLKVHAKGFFVVRREDDGSIMRYTHLSTGNYNEKTARLYVDLSMFSASPALASDLGLFFNMLTGLSSVTELKALSLAPFDLKRRIIAMIDREAERSTPESPGLIAAKMNSLCDKDVIDALYRASCAGVRIMLNVRGVCQLIPGLKGLSESIKVVSIVGRYLEHSRIFYVRNGGAEELYLSSADWMPRNLERRIELMFPVSGTEARERVYAILMSYFLDNRSARVLGPSGHWKRVKAAEGEEPFSVQEYFHAELEGRALRLEDRSDVRELQVRRRAP